ncbi:N-methylhydantoinase B [Arboricoccus pini]|uniref:N-methylhydantoinase B n=1 Tax=Arboricoccus pini TaxID=1963835 RepID=A0A212RMV1_9PROT|nr:hydantoinase B/oxoprolinase family protein [Arboricoccus pini]SNB73859.1 N-methylhydantoinase B [Arboricoccus pini]
MSDQPNAAAEPALESASDTRRVDPFLMAVLKSRFEAIVREMSLVVLKASRSAVIKNGRDFSCAILTYDCRLVSTEDALPIHVTSMDLAIRPILEFFDDIAPGDIYLNNCPYTGGTHHADMIMAMPVFVDGKPLFWAVALSHHADMGAPIPTTYLPFAKNIYEEGLHFPCVRVVERGKERSDVIRIALMKIRASKVWHGDFQAQIGACRTATQRLVELIGRYGVPTVEDFVEDWFDYGERRAIAEIRKLPAGTYRYETRHDPVPGVADAGIPVRIAVTVDPEAGRITVDITDNVDNVPGGLNTSENTASGSCRMGVLNNLDSSIPHNHGSMSRIDVVMGEGKVVGKPRYPVGTSVATTNVNDRLITAGNCAFTAMGAPHGQAEGGGHMPVGNGVISGHDPFKEGQYYISQIFIGYAGNGARHGHDGWLTFCGPANGGLISLDSIEVDESMYPIIVESREIQADTQGFGTYEGAPAVGGVFYPIDHAMTVVYASDGTSFPPAGVLGGTAAASAINRKQKSSGEIVELPAFSAEVVEAGEKLVFRACGGGGYGPPAKRDRARVAASVAKGWLSAEKAKEVYGYEA